MTKRDSAQRLKGFEDAATGQRGRSPRPSMSAPRPPSSSRCGTPMGYPPRPNSIDPSPDLTPNRGGEEVPLSIQPETRAPESWRVGPNAPASVVAAGVPGWLPPVTRDGGMPAVL